MKRSGQRCALAFGGASGMPPKRATSPFPKSSRYAVLCIGATGDVFVQALHEPGQVGQPFAVLSNSGQQRLPPRLVALSIAHWKQAQPAFGHFVVRSMRCGLGLNRPCLSAECSLWCRIFPAAGACLGVCPSSTVPCFPDGDREAPGEFANPSFHPLPSVLVGAATITIFAAESCAAHATRNTTVGARRTERDEDRAGVSRGASIGA